MVRGKPVARVADVVRGSTHRVVVDGLEILLCNVGGRIYAIEDMCTHEGTPLDGGQLEDVRITCPLHGAVFDVTTGAVLALPAIVPLRTFPVEIENGEVYVVL